VAVLVSGGGTNLQALIDASARGETPHALLALVVSSRVGVRALERARAAGIPSSVISRKDCASAGDFDKRLLDELKKNKIDAVVLAGYLTILGGEVLSAYAGRIINVHPSLIPAFCGDGWYGLRPHRAALERGVKLTGATVHLVNGVTDGGRILAQKAVEVFEGDTPESLQRRVMEQAEWQLLPAALEELCLGLEA
jgi:phosphoribosylglycinamide formyltransferase-1